MQHNYTFSPFCSSARRFQAPLSLYKADHSCGLVAADFRLRDSELRIRRGGTKLLVACLVSLSIVNMINVGFSSSIISRRTLAGVLCSTSNASTQVR